MRHISICDKDLEIFAIVVEAPSHSQIQYSVETLPAIPKSSRGRIHSLQKRSLAEYTICGKDIHILDAVLKTP